MDRNKPIQRFRVGRIQVAVWANKGARGTWFSVTASRSYRNDQGHWQDSNGFALQDLPLLCRVLDQAYDYLYSRSRLPGVGEEGEEAPAGCDSAPESWTEAPAEPA